MRGASILLLASVGFAGVLGASSALAQVGDVIPATVAPARISTWDRNPITASGHLFRFQVMIDACPALLEPDHAVLVERPRVATHKGAAIVTAYVREPEHEETDAPCPPLPPLFKGMQVRTKRHVSSLIFFDGSSSPPTRIFPPLPHRSE